MAISQPVPIRELLDLIESALTQVGSQYYRILTTYKPKGIIRERIFCYELYHQLRLARPNNHPLVLHGEIDKRGHRDFDKQDRANPDFVFHVAGTFSFNTLVIEVKGTLDIDGIEKDFNTILMFVGKYGYIAGVFILYNYSFDDLMKRVGQQLKKISASEYADSIFILTIKRNGMECEEHRLSQV